MWKSKLRKHEEKVLAQATSMYRNEKRQEKIRMEKLKAAQEKFSGAANPLKGPNDRRLDTN